jgi:hypothetical protein
MSSSGMWRCVDLALTDVSEERIASIFTVDAAYRPPSATCWYDLHHRPYPSPLC